MRQQRVAADALRPHYKASGAVHRPSRHAAILRFFYGNRFARDHRLVHRSRAFQNYSVHGNLFSRPNPEAISGFNLFERYVRFRAIIAHQTCRLGCEPQQSFDRSAGLAAGAQLQHLAQQHQSGNHRSGVEVNAYFAAATMKRLGKSLREKRCGETVDVGSADTDGDESKHIETAVDDGSPTALEERPSAPEDHRSRQQELEPVQRVRRKTALHRLSRNQIGHGEKNNRRAQPDADPKAARHIDKLGIGFFLQGYGSGLERHAAYWARSWLLAYDVGMHGTNVLCFDRWRGWGCRLQSHAALGASAGLGLAHLGIHRTDIDSIL